MPTENEKQLTAMQQLKAELEDRMNRSVFANEFNAYKNIFNLIDTELLATERQQLIDAYCEGQSAHPFEYGKDYFNNTFKTT